MRQYQLITAERELLEDTLNGSIKALAEILALAEPKSFRHNEALREDIRRLAKPLEIGQTWEIEAAAMLSHIGYVTLPPEVALKARVGHPLSDKEQEMFQRIPAIGGNLLAQIPRLGEVSRIILYQNKRFDGSGFPADNVCGEEIPLGARLLKILFDLAQVEAKGSSRGAALEQLRARPGWYDPRLLDAIASCFQLASTASADSVKQPLPVTFSNLRPGHTLVSDVETKDGILIVSAGSRMTPALLHRLRNFAELSGVKEPIYVES